MKSAFFLLALLLLQFTVNAQMKIGDNPTSINGASLLELETTNKGFVFPRVSITSISTPAPLPAGLLTGTVVYNTNAAVTGGSGVGLYLWNGSSWNVINSGAIPGTAWSLTGNSGLNAANNFIGTINAVDFVVRTNNTERMRITGASGSITPGWVGIGTAAPAAPLNIVSTSATQDMVYIQNLSPTGYSTVNMLSSTGPIAFSLGYANSGTPAYVSGKNFLNTTNKDFFITTNSSANKYPFFLQNSTGYIGIGTGTPSNALSVLATNPLYLSGVQATSTFTTDSILTINAGVVKKAPYSSLPSGGGSGWLITGNSGTTSSNFIGTTDNVGFRVRTNNIQRLLVDSLGNIVIGKGDNTTTPAGDTIRGPNGSGTNIAGGNLTLKGGNASGTATGGALNLFGGISASGAGLQGDVSMQGRNVKAKLRKGGSFFILNDSTPGNELVKLLIKETGEVNWYLDGKDLFIRDGFFDAFGNGTKYKYDFMHIDGTTGRIGFNVLGGYSDGTPGGENDLPLTSSVTLLGSIATKVRLLDGSNNYVIQQDDHIMIIDKSDNGNTDMILSPVATSRGREYIFKRNNNSDGAIIVKPAPGEKINGIVDGDVTLGQDNSTLEVVCGPDSWWVISEISVTAQAEVTTTSITASDKDLIEVNFTGASQSIDISLPAAAGNEDKRYIIKRNANGALYPGNVLRIVPASGENLDQYTFASPYIMENVFQSVTVRSNGTNWVILNNYNAENTVAAVTTAYTPYKNDKTILADASSASFTVTLPGAATVEKGKTYTVKRTNAGANTVIVDGNGSETMDGIASLRLNQRFDYLQLQSDGTNWMIISERISPSLVVNPALPYTATAYDGIIASNGAGTINLPGTAAVLGGKIFTIKNSARAGNRTITVTPNGAETVDGLATWPLTRGQFVTIQSDGTNWIVIGQ